MELEKITPFGSPVEAAINIIGGKYKIVIIWHLSHQTLRFNQLQKLVYKASPKMLSQQLKELERDGLINRVLYPVVPPKTEYSLTEQGKALLPAILELCAWSESYFKDIGVENPCQKLRDSQKSMLSGK